MCDVKLFCSEKLAGHNLHGCEFLDPWTDILCPAKAISDLKQASQISHLKVSIMLMFLLFTY